MCKFKASNFTSYIGYCTLMNTAIIEAKLTNKQKQDIYVICEVLDKVFGLDSKKIGIYINEYFFSEKYLLFEKTVLLTSEIFPNLEPIVNIMG